MREDEQIMTKQTHKTIDAQTKTNCLGIISRKITRGGVDGVGMGLKLVLLARNLIFNYDDSPNYKYMFGPHRGPLPRPSGGEGVTFYIYGIVRMWG